MPTRNQIILRRSIFVLWLGCIGLGLLSMQQNWPEVPRYVLHLAGFVSGLVASFLYSKDPNKTPVLWIEEYLWLMIATFAIFGGVVIPKSGVTQVIGSVLFFGLIAAFVLAVPLELWRRRRKSRG